MHATLAMKEKYILDEMQKVRDIIDDAARKRDEAIAHYGGIKGMLLHSIIFHIATVGGELHCLV